VVARSAGSYLVIAFFESRAEAGGAMLAAAIEANSASRQGRFGMLASDDRGRPEAVGCGENRDCHARLGAVLGQISAALRGGVMPARNHFFDPRSELTTDDVVRFGAELDAGNVAVAALAARPSADRIVVLLAGLGGKTEIHRLSDRALREAASAGS
jgi:hypothetical protein